MGLCVKLSIFVALMAAIGPVLWQYRDLRQFNNRTNADEAAYRVIPVDFSGKTAIVTGASAGIGIETARVLLERGILLDFSK